MQRSGFLGLLGLAGCSRGSHDRAGPLRGALPSVRLAALGDSLAFGTGASSPENGFIFRAFETVRAQRPDSEIDNLAMGGSTAADVLRLQVSRLAKARYDAVIVCVGGNDVVRRIDSSAFATTYDALIAAVRRAQPSAAVVCCGVPNVGVSPLFAGLDRAEISRLARADDGAVRRAAQKRGAAFVDLFSGTTLRRGQEGRFLSDDRFHPSDEGYAQLAGVLEPVLARVLRARSGTSQILQR